MGKKEHEIIGECLKTLAEKSYEVREKQPIFSWILKRVLLSYITKRRVTGNSVTGGCIIVYNGAPTHMQSQATT